MNVAVSPVRQGPQGQVPDAMQGGYTVKRGDTLWAIARELGISLAALKAANPDILNPDVMYPDQQIRLPQGAARERGEASSGSSEGSGPESAVTNQPATVAGAQGAIGGDGVTAAQLQRIVPGMSSARAAEVAPHLNSAMREANINTPRRQAMFIAQLAHESGGFRYREEIWGPTPAQRGYEGRRDLGNTQPGDGYRFRGRGYIQLTGRYNYEKAGRALGLDLVNNPDLAAQPQNAARVAAWYWNSRNINAAADANDFTRVTRLINGGTNGLADRQAYYARARDVMGNGGGTTTPAPNDPPPRNDPPSSGRYTIRSGDTLSGIAARHDTTVSAIMAANRGKISNADLIYAGQTINLPGGGGNSGRSSNYTIRSGDTLSGIASRHDTSVSAIMAANRGKIRNADLIYAGQTIAIPGRNSDAAASNGSTYTIRSGDTLSGIASRHGTTVGQLMSANSQIRDSNLIYAGQSIRIPGGSQGNESPGSTKPPGGNTPTPPFGNAPVYSPYTVYSTGHRAAFAVKDANQLQPHHDYQTRVRDGQTLEVRDVVLHRNGQSQTRQTIPSPIEGTVLHAGPWGTAGNAVKIRDASGKIAWIFHMSSIDVRVGQRVGYGQDLGNQGSTGNSTGPHVHIEAAPAVIDRWVNDLIDGRFDGLNR